MTRVLPYVPAEAEAEVSAAYDRTVKARVQGEEAREVADPWLFETVVRLHRAGEGPRTRGSSSPGRPTPTPTAMARARRTLDRVDVEEAVVLVVSAWSSSVTRRCRGGGGGEAAGASGVGAENDRLGSRLGRLAKTSVSPAPAPPAGQS